MAESAGTLAEAETMRGAVARDILSEARELADAIAERAGEPAARRITDAIDGGSTGSEILFDLGFELDRLLERGAAAEDAELNAWMLDLRQAIENALQ